MKHTALLLGLALLTSGCVPRERGPRPPAVEDLTPAFLATVSGIDPEIAADGAGRVAITWVTRDSAGRADVWFAASSDSGATFAAPQRLNSKPGNVASYAESRPVVALGRGGQVVVAWAAHRDSGESYDDIVARSSTDGGASFGDPQFVNDDHTDPRSTYHGFLALDVSPEGEAALAWIDGRAAAAAGQLGEPASGEIWTSVSRNGGRSWAANVRAADSVCACCRLGMRAGGAGRWALAYRTARGDLRDPRLAISRDGGVTFALDTLISRDGWRLNGCPSHGPALSPFAGGGHVAWFTDVPAITGVQTATWRDDGALASAPRRLDDGLREAERPALATDGRGAFAGLIGVPVADTTRRVFAVRMLAEDGRGGPWALLGVRAKTAALAGTGGHRAYACWSDETPEGPRLRVARIERNRERD